MKHKIVRKSNVLIEASYKLSTQEQRIILYLVSQIRPEDDDFKEYSIAVKDFASLVGLQHHDKYEDVREITKKLIGRVFTIKSETADLQVSWLSSAEYIHGKGTVVLSFDSKLKPFLLQLKSRFTKYKLYQVMQLKSSFSIRLYELLKQYQSLGVRVLEVAALREQLGIEKEQYKNFNDFKRFVLLAAKEELAEKTDISFDFEEIKVGRGVGKIRFDIKSKDDRQSEPIEAEDIIPISPKNAELINVLELLPPDYREQITIRKLLKSWIDKKGYDYVARNVEYANVGSNAVNPTANKKAGSNYRVYLSKALAGDFGLAYKEDKQVRENIDEKLRLEREAKAKEQREQENRDQLERENQDRARIYQESLTQEALSALREEALNRLDPSHQELVRRKTPGTERLLKIAMTKICLERMKISSQEVAEPVSDRA